MISEPILCRSFVGRARELEHFAERRRGAAAGRGGTVLVAGEAGIGKSRLLAEFRRSLASRAVRVASSGCREFAQRPLGPWFDILAALDPRAAAVFARGTFESRDALMAALVDAFGSIAGRATTVVFVEDLHWADPDIARVLLELTKVAAAARLLFVGTYRDDELTNGHPCFPLIGKVLRERSASLVRLAPFDDREMTQILADASRSAPALRDGVLRDVRKRADGNALFGEELLRHAVDLRYGEHDAADLPHSLDAIVRERLERCVAGDRDLLIRASLLGRTFDVEVIADAFGVDAAECREAMERLEALQLVDRGESPEAAYRFRHALTRDVVYGEIPAGSLPELHGRIALAIARRDASDRYAEWLAHHYALAGERERAAPFCVAAGDAARAVHAYEDAATWYERAAALYGGSIDVAGALLAAGLMHVYCGGVDRALALYERAGAAFEIAGRYEDSIAARVMAAGALHDDGRVDDAVALLRATKERFDARVTREVRDRLNVRLGFLYAFALRTDEAWNVVRAIDAETLDSVSAIGAEANFLYAAVAARLAEAEQWQKHLERGLEIFERIDAARDHVRAALSNGAQQALALGDTDAAFAYQERAFAIARSLNSGREYEGAVLAEIELMRGNLERAGDLLDDSNSAAKFIARAQSAIVAAALARLRGDENGAARVDLALLDEAANGGHAATAAKLACAFAALLEASGRDVHATRLLARATAAIDAAYDMAMPLATIVRLRPKLAAEIRPLVERAAQRPGDRVARALLSMCDAIRARDAGDYAAAGLAGRDAARRFLEFGWRVLAAGALEAGGDEAGARDAYRSMGAHGEVRRLERRVAREPKSRSLLTRRERELALVIAAGRTNRAAADELSISEKAVEKHLTSIYAKLGISSRAQLVAYMMES